jgi:predicted adenylyl cyclase CyaB
MDEVEVKILDVDRDAVVRRLLAAGARPDVDQEMHALYFDTPGRDLSRRRDSLRLRREGERVILNFKAHVASTELKVRKETEVEVSDIDGARRILEGLGYEVWLEMRKRRLGYAVDALPGVHFVFDRYSGEHAYVPEYLEVEAPTAALVREAVALVGFAMEQTVPWNAYEVFEHYRRG